MADSQAIEWRYVIKYGTERFDIFTLIIMVLKVHKVNWMYYCSCIYE